MILWRVDGWSGSLFVGGLHSLLVTTAIVKFLSATKKYSIHYTRLRSYVELKGRARKCISSEDHYFLSVGGSGFSFFPTNNSFICPVCRDLVHLFLL